MIKNKKLYIGLAVGILAAIALVAVSYPDSQKGKTSDKAAALGLISSLAAPEINYDFGTVSMAAGKVAHEFEIQNNSSSTLSLDKLYTSCMCTGAYFVSAGDRIGPFGMPGHGFVPGLGQRMEAGEKAKIEVVFDPAAHGPAGVGPIVRGIYLESAGSVKEFGIKAVVIP